MLLPFNRQKLREVEKCLQRNGTAPNNRELSVLRVDEDTLTKISYCYVCTQSLNMQSTEKDFLILTALH